MLGGDKIWSWFRTQLLRSCSLCLKVFCIWKIAAYIIQVYTLTLNNGLVYFAKLISHISSHQGLKHSCPDVYCQNLEARLLKKYIQVYTIIIKFEKFVSIWHPAIILGLPICNITFFSTLSEWNLEIIFCFFSMATWFYILTNLFWNP